MQIVTNPGSNLSSEVVEQYGIHITPQEIVVDGMKHDTRAPISFDEIDTWVRTAKQHPYVLGTPASDFVRWFTELPEGDSEILSIQTSRKLIGSHDAAVAAVRTLKSQRRWRHLQIRVVDTMFTDSATGLMTILAAEAMRAGMSLEECARTVESARREMSMCFSLATLDNLVKGGRASAFRALIADFLKIRPLVTMTDGELRLADKIKATADRAAKVCEWTVARVGKKRPVWLSVAHGGAVDEARALQAALAEALDVRFSYPVPVAASTYLHAGPRVVAAYVLPIDELPWQPTTPAPRGQ